MLVALPSAIAFGVTIYAPLGSSSAATGAVAGMLGATALGLVAPALGGAKRLITAPCAPAAAVLSAFALGLLEQDVALDLALLSMVVLGLMAGGMQVVFGAVGLGRLIKYMPYPVVSGYLSGVGLYIIASQVPRLLGMPKDAHFWDSLAAPAQWQWQSLVVGAVTMVVMVGAAKLTKLVPAAILALVGGVLTYFGLGLADGSLLTLDGNALVVGHVGGSAGGLVEAFASRWWALRDFGLEALVRILVPALTLAVLLSIDTLKTCVVLDALTRSRHDSNRELVAQGLGNIASAVVGGVPGAGTMGATLVNLSSGAKSRLSGVIEGVLSLLAFLVLGSFIAWVPIAALAGILIVVGVRMIDGHSLSFLRARSTVLDFAVIVAVVVVALTVSLIAASGIGVVLAVILFVREQIGGSVVRRKSFLNQVFSKKVRLPEEMHILEERGDEAVVFELQGSLFFGTTDKLYTALEPELQRRYVILDMRRVQSVDITAAHMLDQIEDMLRERGSVLILSQIPKRLPSGRDIHKYFDEVGLVRPQSTVRVFDGLDDAVQWVEERIIEEAALDRSERSALELVDFDVFKGRKEETMVALAACMTARSFGAGERIFARGDEGDELCLIRRGQVRITLPLADGYCRHLGTFGRGDFFGEMSFLDGAKRSADAVAETEVELFTISRHAFDGLADGHKKIALRLLEGIASALSSRLRYANAEIRALE